MRKVLVIIILIAQTGLSQISPVSFKEGIDLINEEKYSEAIVNLENKLSSQDLTHQAIIYYLIGIANLELENYPGALNSFETALDISVDPKLDTRLDEQIDITIRRQNFAESGKKRTKFSYYAGAGYDSNLLNLSKDSFIGTDISSYSAIYGLSLSHSLVRKMSFQLAPELSFTDSYSVNTTFAADSTIQSSDAMQLGFLLPAFISLDLFSAQDSTSPQVGVKTLYLPTDSEKRSLAFTSVFLNWKNVFNFSEYYIFMPQFSVSLDKSSLTYVDSADDQSATRMTLDLNNTFMISEDRHQVNLNLTGEQNNADGENSSYTKMAAGLELRLSVIPTYNIGLLTKYIQTDYTKRTTERNDRQNQFSLDVTKNFSADRSVSMTLGSASRSSNSTINAYQDMTLSLIFADSYSF